MREFALFAATFLSLSLFGADLRTASDPKLIAKVFPAQARLRLVNVWATWCVPCVAEMADLRAVDEAFGSEVAIAGVSLDDMIPDTKKEQVEAFLDRQKVTFPNVYYTGSPDALGDHFGFDGAIPLTILYDAKGVELWRTQGTIRKDEMIARLREMLRRTR
jgi:thiol-disulfide isomerase/thioredoxin